MSCIVISFLGLVTVTEIEFLNLNEAKEAYKYYTGTFETDHYNGMVRNQT
jgi:hypothetical protein